eukprot:TRINITY_DN502_c0_g1_i1.p1 TRINITY_DN502_c0_g1~~TRINITY_DN502_c0_g1_i1.p1  ORF type:complete len:1113 (+),score=268.30 TRINITY_DN502_c0_g1_i1:285-3623(+)
MVQRKAANKVRIQPDSKKNHVKSEKRSVALKSSSQHQDMRNKGGGDLKKRMKAARSFKALELERLESPQSREYLRFEKPVVDTPSAATPQKKLSPINVAGRSPNYMKPTSSSDARKERLQVSPDNFQSSRRNSNYSKSSASGLKTMKVLTKSSSLKPVRSSMKKSSGVALYPVNRATCSSTLKDSKFPVSVMLHPGGTESEGTSVMKVCPYTYCSLNGHHHAPLPPLKHFLSARRRLLRTQKSMKLKGLSPVRIKCSGKSKNEIDTGQMAFSGDHAILDLDPDASAISPLIEEMGSDFFVEIYVKSSEEISESVDYNNGINIHCGGNEEPKFKFSVHSEVSSVGHDELVHGPSDGTDKETENDRVAETQLDAYNKISFEDNVQENSDFPLAEMESESGDGGEIIAEIELDGSASEATDMDWEEQVDVVPYPDTGSECSMFDGDRSEFATAFLPWSEDLGLHDELVSDSDDTVSVGTYEEGLENEEMLHEMPKEDAESFLAAFSSGSSKGNNPGTEYGNHSPEIDESGNSGGEVFDVTNGLIQNQLTEVLDLNPKQIEPEPSDECDHNSIESIYSSIPSASSAFEELREASEDDGNLKEDFFQGHNLLKEDNEDRFQEQIFTPNRKDQRSEIDESGNGSEEVSDVSNVLIQNQLMEILDLNPEQIEPEPSNEYDQNIIEIIYSSIPMAPSATSEEPTEASEENENPNGDEFPQGKSQLKDNKEHSFDEHNCNPDVTYRTMIDEQEHESLQVEMEDEIMEYQVSGQKHYETDEDVGTQLNQLQELGSVSDSQKYIGSETDKDLATNDHSPEHALSRTNVEDRGEMKEQLEDAHRSLKIRTSDQDIAKEDQNTSQLKIDIEACLSDIIIKDEKCGEDTLLDHNSNVPDQCLSPKTSDCSSDDQLDNGNIAKNQECSENYQSKLGDCNISFFSYNEECSGMERKEASSAEECIRSNDKMQIEDDTKLEAAETSLAADIKSPEEDKNIIDTGTDPEQSLPKTCSNNRGRKLIRKGYAEHMEQERKFNPRAPHHLLIEPDPEAEKVDLRHQEIDERKNSEEWMIDYALQRAVSKLAPARKRKVSLLVEAFETVMPLPKCEIHLQRATFTHARPIQACS